MSTSFLLGSLIFALIYLLGYLLGYRKAFYRGKAVGWQEHYFECVARNRARRQRNGQFRSLKNGGAS